MNPLVIVAIPAEDDYVNRISSEKVPHMTLVYLGEDATKVKNLGKILDFVGHAADQSLLRFGMEVDHRGVLGPDLADVLFFSKAKWSGFETVNQYRSYLLKNDNIRTAYDSTTQFPEFIPHLTLGYPTTPAKPDERDYPGINHVSFDRIAVWFGDFEGIEFPLKAYEWDMDFAMGDINKDAVGELLEHHGVLGMKWGHRGARASGPEKVGVRSKGKKLKTSGGRGFPAHADAIRARKTGQIGKKSGLKSLSNQELQAYTQRMNLEASAKRASFNDKSAGKKFVAKLLGQTGSNQAHTAANDIASQQVKKVLTKAALVAF